MELFIKERLLAQLEARASASEASGARSLLSVLCDAVVQLGPDLRIEGHPQRLGQLLMMSSCGASLSGQDFSGYITEADRPRLEAFLDATLKLAREKPNPETQEPSSTPPASLHVHMRDSAGVLFSAELFHAYLHDLRGQPAHLVGICEGSARRMPMASAMDCDFVLPTRLPEAHPTVDSCSRSASSGSSSTSSKNVTADEGLKCLSSIEVSFDPFADDLPVYNCSFNFFADENKPEELQYLPSLKHYLAVDVQKKFCDWLHNEINHSYVGKLPKKSKMQGLVFRLPHAKSSKLLKADVALTVAQENSTTEEDEADDSEQSSNDGLSFNLVLHNFKRCRKKATLERSLPIIDES